METEAALPLGWQRVKLGEVGQLSGGGTPSTKEAEYWNGQIHWLTPNEVPKNGSLFVSVTQRTISEEGLKSSSAKLLPVGTVMLTSRATIGEVAINTVPMATNQGFINVICDEQMASNKFLAYWMMHNKEAFIERAHGAIFKEITKSNFKPIPIILPPLPEQQAIAEVLGTVQAALAARRREQQLEQEHKAALFEQLFTQGSSGGPTRDTELGPVPVGWEVVRLGEVFSTQLGKMLSPKSKTGDEPKLYLRNSNVQWGRVNFQDLLRMDFSEKEQAKFNLKRGDLLMCEGGEIGRTAIWNDEVADCYFQKAIHRLRPRNENVSPEFYLHFMEWAFRFADVYKVIGTKTTIAHLPQEKLNMLKIPLPPLPEQQRIAAVLGALDAKLGALGTEVARLEELFRALLEELLSGRRRVGGF